MARGTNIALGFVWAVCAACGGQPAPDGGAITHVTSLPGSQDQATSLRVLNFPSNVDARGTATLTVEALNSSSSVQANYAGTVSFSSSDVLATLPAEYTFQPVLDAGHKTFSVRLRTFGSQDVEISDSNLASSSTRVQTVVSWPSAGFTTPDGSISSRPARSFIAQGRTWLAYTDSSASLQLISSTDGVTWSAPQVLRANMPCDGDGLAIASNGTFMDYAVSGGNVDTGMLYRRATLHPDGTFTWAAAEQVAVPATKSEANWFVSLAIDATGKPWVGYLPTTAGYGAGNYFASTVTASTGMDGAGNGDWNTLSGFPVATSAYDGFDLTYAVPLANGSVYLATLSAGNSIAGQLWNSATGEFSVSEAICGSNCGNLSAAAQGDDVVFTFNQGKPFYSVTRTFATSSIGTPVTLNFINAPSLSSSLHGSVVAVGLSAASDGVVSSVTTGAGWTTLVPCVSGVNLSGWKLIAGSSVSPQGQVAVMLRDPNDRVSTITCP